MRKKLKKARSQALRKLEKIYNIKQLNSWRSQYLGKNSALTSLTFKIYKQTSLTIEKRDELLAFAKEILMHLESMANEKEEELMEI